MNRNNIIKNIVVISIFGIILMASSVVYAQETEQTSADSLAVVDSVKVTEDNISDWEKANNAYSNGQYQVAQILYENLVGQGYKDAPLLYNLGNSYFQQNQIGKAIINYKRALLSDPSNEDITYNLELAKSKTKDKINAVPTFFLIEWFNAIKNLLNTNEWAIMAIALLVLDLIMILLWLLANSLRIRKIGFYTALLLTILFISSLINSYSSASTTYDTNEAIIINSAAIMKSSPSENGKDLVVLHEGTSVEIIQSLNEWNEVELVDGNKGWILSSAMEKIITE